MSQETSIWRATVFLVGFGKVRSWWHRKESERIATDNGLECPTYPDSIPVEDVERRLFSWEPEEVPMTYPFRGSTRTAPGRKVMIRSDNGDALGVFSERYAHRTYRTSLLRDAENILSASRGELGIASAFLLQNGGQAAVQYELPETIQTPSGFPVRPYVLAFDSLNGTLRDGKKVCVQAAVCDNTLRLAIGENGNVFGVKHTRNIGVRVAEAREVLGLLFASADDAVAEIETLAAQVVTEKQWQAFLDAYSPIPEDAGRSRSLAESKRDALDGLWSNDLRVTPWKGTALGVLQAANTYAHHFATVRNMDRAERNMSNAVGGTTDAADARTLAILGDVLASA